MRRVIGIVVLALCVTWLAVCVDWPVVIAWLASIWHTLSSTMSAAYEMLVSVGLIPDAIHPERMQFPTLLS